MKSGIYKHSKTGNLYKVHFMALDADTLEDTVIYEALYDNPKSKFWVRKLSDFTKVVDVNGKKTPRFVLV